MTFEVAYARLKAAGKDRSWEKDPEDPNRPETIQAMQIVLNLDKQDPPGRTAVLEAAARAVVSVCLDPRAGQDGAFAQALGRWYGLRIRKVARRARNKAWKDVQSLPGVTVDGLARAFVPSAVCDVPHQLAKLQINGTELPADNPARPDPGTPAIYADASLNMTAGKAAAQVGHGAMLLAAHMPLEWVRRWAEDDFPLSVREVEHEFFLRACQAPQATVIRDAGFTEVAPNSATVVALPQAGLVPSH